MAPVTGAGEFGHDQLARQRARPDALLYADAGSPGPRLVPCPDVEDPWETPWSDHHLQAPDGVHSLRSCVYSRVSESARLGTTKDKRKTGRMLFPLHRKLTISPSATSTVLVRLEFRPLRTCRV